MGLEAPGAIVKVKIGKKTYTGTVGKDNKVKIKIKKKPQYGKKFTITAYYKGKLIAKSWDYVWYAKRVKKGMTKKQVRWCLTAGKPLSKVKQSRGRVCWVYFDGAKVYFKNNKVIKIKNTKYYKL